MQGRVWREAVQRGAWVGALPVCGEVNMAGVHAEERAVAKGVATGTNNRVMAVVADEVAVVGEVGVVVGVVVGEVAGVVVALVEVASKKGKEGGQEKRRGERGEEQRNERRRKRGKRGNQERCRTSSLRRCDIHTWTVHFNVYCTRRKSQRRW